MYLESNDEAQIHNSAHYVKAQDGEQQRIAHQPPGYTSMDTRKNACTPPTVKSGAGCLSTTHQCESPIPAGTEEKAGRNLCASKPRPIANHCASKPYRSRVNSRRIFLKSSGNVRQGNKNSRAHISHPQRVGIRLMHQNPMPEHRSTEPSGRAPRACRTRH